MVCVCVCANRLFESGVTVLLTEYDSEMWTTTHAKKVHGPFFKSHRSAFSAVVAQFIQTHNSHFNGRCRCCAAVDWQSHNNSNNANCRRCQTSALYTNDDAIIMPLKQRGVAFNVISFARKLGLLYLHYNNFTWCNRRERAFLYVCVCVCVLVCLCVVSSPPHEIYTPDSMPDICERVYARVCVCVRCTR